MKSFIVVDCVYKDTYQVIIYLGSKIDSNTAIVHTLFNSLPKAEKCAMRWGTKLDISDIRLPK
jgi:hypothetical protein